MDAYQGCRYGGTAAPLLFLLPRITCALALLEAANTVAAERQRGTWEILKATIRSPELVIRAKWTAVHCRLRPLLLILMLPRMLLVGHAIMAPARYQGHYLDLYLTDGPPQSRGLRRGSWLLRGLRARWLRCLWRWGFTALWGCC